MSEHLTYSDLSSEDKILMDGLFQHKEQKIKERKNLRDLIAQLRKKEMDCTKEIMNLSQRKISEKFDLSCNTSKPFSKKVRRELNKELNTKKEPIFYCNCTDAYLSDQKTAA